MKKYCKKEIKDIFMKKTNCTRNNFMSLETGSTFHMRPEKNSQIYSHPTDPTFGTNLDFFYNKIWSMKIFRDKLYPKKFEKVCPEKKESFVIYLSYCFGQVTVNTTFFFLVYDLALKVRFHPHLDWLSRGNNNLVKIGQSYAHIWKIE